MAEVVVTKSNFETEVVKSDIPVVVDFWATWCGPCRMLGPVLADIAEQYEGKVKVAKVNVDEEPELAMRFNVSSIPMLLYFKNGEILNKSIGYAPKEEIEAMFV
ncbi:MAG: thioredoxin [Monoglobaceae bacterium]